MPHFTLGVHDDKPVQVDVDILLRTRLLIQANSGGGKSYAIRLIAERLFGKVQVIIIDPEGEFSTLREKYGYVLVGKGGETPADPRSAGLVAEKLLELHASAVCDLYEMKPADRHRWVRLFLEALVDAPKKLWHPVVVIVDEAHGFCMDDSTELLTKEGWKKYADVKVGQEVVAFDPKTEKYSYEPIERVIVGLYDGPMINLKSDGIDQLITPEHRVVLRRIQRGQKQGRKAGAQKSRSNYMHFYPWTFCMAEKVPRQIYIPIGGAPFGPGVPNLTEDDCELMGWVVTDGSFVGKQGNLYKKYLSISQAYSTTKGNLKMVEEIASLLDRIGVRYSRYERKKRRIQRLNGQVVKHAPSVEFYLGVGFSSHLLDFFGGEIHRIPRILLEMGSESQLRALWKGALHGDGTHGKVGWSAFYPGKEEGLADDFQELGLRLGISVSKKFVPQNRQFTVRISRRKHHYIRRATRQNYSGIVWDITVPSGAFVARRNGKVFVTGNCPEKSAGESEASDAMIALATRGRKRGFAAVFATQRLGKLRKDAAAELQNVLVGLTTIDIDRKRAADQLGIYGADQRGFFDDVKMLKPGYFYALGRAISTDKILLKVGTVETTHPEAGSVRHNLEPPPPPEKVMALLPKLADLPKAAEEKARTEADLRNEIRELKAKLKQSPSPLKVITPVVDDKAVRKAVKMEAERWRKVYREQHELLLKFTQAIQRLASVSQTLPGEPIDPAAPPNPFQEKEIGLSLSDQTRLSPPRPAEKKVFHYSAEINRQGNLEIKDANPLTGPEQRILNAIAWCESIGNHSPEQTAVAFLAGYKIGGGAFNNPRGSLRVKGLIEYSGQNLQLTDEGRKLAQAPTTPLDSSEIQHSVLNRLPGPERRLLEALLRAGENGLTNEELAAESGYTLGGGAYNNPRGRLRTLGLIEYRGDRVVPRSILFID
ncbi:MAG TPA: DUF87 domain-containing protein [Terriglobia bacterium]|nr:DUF87 domain-containing protein [Terriglobia bacterium]